MKPKMDTKVIIDYMISGIVNDPWRAKRLLTRWNLGSSYLADEVLTLENINSEFLNFKSCLII